MFNPNPTQQPPTLQASLFILTAPQLQELSNMASTLISKKLNFTTDPKDLVGSAIAMAHLDGKLATYTEIFKHHEDNLKKFHSATN